MSTVFIVDITLRAMIVLLIPSPVVCAAGQLICADFATFANGFSWFNKHPHLRRCRKGDYRSRVIEGVGMESTNLVKRNEEPAEEAAGELVLQNGRQAGTRRPLGTPTTFIGRSQACDIRLNIDGIDAMHCVLAFAPDGLHARDLNSSHGTYVNGERIDTTLIRHGDLLKIGPFQFRVEMSATGAIDRPISVVDPTGDLREAIQVQVAAVVAQQISLEEDEARLIQRQSDMQQQEEQLAAHLAETYHSDLHYLSASVIAD